uniref:Glucosylceramidase n=1 Tax=Panagrolaimus superbus TaxID=310955 RepID=A0A914YVB1_9BILA
MSRLLMKKVLYSYFNPKGGIGYTFGRVPIASTDFSTRIYSYDDTSEDFELKNFKLQEEDFKYKIPFIKDANIMTGNKLKLVGSPWSAPAWMKASHNMTGIGGLIGDVTGKYYSTWASYFVKFLKEYAKAGIKFWGITIQNEPSSGLLPHYYWQTMAMDAKTQVAFVRLHLKPAIDKSIYANKLKIMAHDDNRPGLLTAALEIMNDKEGAKFIDGYAVHWYMDDYGHLSRLNETHDLDESKFILNTEACNGFRSPLRGVWLGSWARAERYAKDIIESLNNWSTGWIDWNLCLDVIGGPTWAKNNVDSPIIVIPENDTFYKQPMYYAMGAFSRFIPPNSVRLHSWALNTNYRDLSFTSFKTPQNVTVLVLLNRGNNEIALTLDDVERASTKMVSLASRSITTILWNSF